MSELVLLPAIQLLPTIAVLLVEICVGMKAQKSRGNGAQYHITRFQSLHYCDEEYAKKEPDKSGHRFVAFYQSKYSFIRSKKQRNAAKVNQKPAVS